MRNYHVRQKISSRLGGAITYVPFCFFVLYFFLKENTFSKIVLADFLLGLTGTTISLKCSDSAWLQARAVSSGMPGLADGSSCVSVTLIGPTQIMYQPLT